MECKNCSGTVTTECHGSKPLPSKPHDDTKRAMRNMKGSPDNKIFIKRNKYENKEKAVCTFSAREKRLGGKLCKESEGTAKSNAN